MPYGNLGPMDYAGILRSYMEMNPPKYPDSSGQFTKFPMPKQLFGKGKFQGGRGHSPITGGSGEIPQDPYEIVADPAPAPVARQFTPAPAQQAPAPGYEQAYLDSQQADRDQMDQMGAASIALQGGQEEQAAIDEQMAQADELRNARGGGGRGYGGVYTAENPMEEIGALIKQYEGNKERKGLLKEGKALRTKTNDARADIVNAIRNRGKPKKADMDIADSWGNF